MSLKSTQLMVAIPLIAGCAVPATRDVADASPAIVDCVQVTGTNVCRKPGSGNPNVVNSYSGEDLRRSGAPITGAQPGRIVD